MGIADVRWLDDREERAWRSLRFTQMRLDGELGRRLGAESGLPYQHYVVLVALTGSLHGRMRLFEFARALGWKKSRVSRRPDQA